MRKWGPLTTPIFHSTRQRKTKRFTDEVLAFSMIREEECLRAAHEISTLTYKQGPYTVFKVYEPKRTPNNGVTIL